MPVHRVLKRDQRRLPIRAPTEAVDVAYLASDLLESVELIFAPGQTFGLKVRNGQVEVVVQNSGCGPAQDIGAAEDR